MEQILLTASRRKGRGKGIAQALRFSNQVPAIIYAPKQKPIKLSITVTDLEKVLKIINGKIFFITLNIENEASRVVLIKDFQRDYLGRRLLHIDFYEINPKEKIILEIGLIFEGKASGMVSGGILNIAVQSLVICGMPEDIPENLTIDISNLSINNSIYVKDLKLPNGIEAVYDKNFLIISCVMPIRNDK